MQRMIDGSFCSSYFDGWVTAMAQGGTFGTFLFRYFSVLLNFVAADVITVRVRLSLSSSRPLGVVMAVAVGAASWLLSMEASACLTARRFVPRIEEPRQRVVTCAGACGPLSSCD